MSICTFSDKIIVFISNATQKRQVKSLVKILAQIEVVNNDFKTDNVSRTTFSYVRKCFDGLIESLPELSSHLAANVKVDAFPDLENAIVKIQRGNKSNLNAQGRMRPIRLPVGMRNETKNLN